MKQIIQYIKDFWQLDFDGRVYGSTALLLAIAIGFNYAYNFEDGYIDSFQRKPVSFLVYGIYYAVPYFSVILIYKIFAVDIPGSLSKAFWITSGLAIFILTFRVGFYWHETFLLDIKSQPQRYFYTKLSRAVVNVLIQGLGVALVYLLWEKHNKNWYGLSWKNFKWQPYALMLLIMLPLIILAATQADFLQAYPRLRLRYFGDDYTFYFAAYEPFYLVGFMVLEWLFRGLLVIGMVKYLGHRAVLPMAALYCVIHFGKPMGECISSIFGGYLLGIFAYYSRSIWGGIIVHMGIALMMDFAALAAWLIKN